MDDDEDESDEAVDGDTQNIKDDNLGFQSKKKLMDSDEDESDEDDNAQLMVSAHWFNGFQFDLNVTMDTLESPVKEVDPRLQFCAAIKFLSQKAPQDI